MKKQAIGTIIAIIIGGCLMTWGLTGCGNKDMWDTVYTFDYAIIKLPNGEIIEGEVDSWTDYEDGDQLQVTIDGKIYLTSTLNCTLIQK